LILKQASSSLTSAPRTYPDATPPLDCPTDARRRGSSPLPFGSRRFAAPIIPHPRQVYNPNHITPVQLIDHTPTPLQSPARWNTFVVVEHHRRHLRSSSFHPLRLTPTFTSPPARSALAPPDPSWPVPPCRRQPPSPEFDRRVSALIPRRARESIAII
jgi:hypothetical protein